MSTKTFELPVRSSSWANPPLEILTMEDKEYTVLGCVQGEPEYGYRDAYYVLMLVEDHEGRQYLVSTTDFTPTEIVKGSQDEMRNKTYEDWGPGGKFYLDRQRDNLVWTSELKLDDKRNWYKLK